MDLRKDIYFYADFASFPATGSTGVLYVDKDTGFIYSWNGSTYLASGTGGLNYLGTWNANTNSPTITSGVGSNGDYYIVGTPGTTNIDGISSWDIGDWIIFGGSAWQKIDNSETTGYVTSVGGTAPIASSGGTTPTISISQANGSTDGYLSSTDWTTFNNKVSSNIYTANGTVTGNRTIDLNGNTLKFSNGIVEFDQGSSNSGEIRLYEDSDFGTNKVFLRAPQAMASDVTFFFPPNNGTNGYVLSTNGAGATSWIAASGGLTKFTEAENTSAPNGTVYVDSLTAAASSTDADAAIVPKGAGALIAAVPNNLTSGGNKRGQYAVDWQMIRNANTQVASGNRSVILGGYNNKSAGDYSVTAGESNNITGTHSVALAFGNGISGNYSFAIGDSNTVSANSSGAIGSTNNIASGRNYAFTSGGNNTISGSGQYQTALGYNNTVSANVGVAVGYQNTASGGSDVAIGRLNIANGTDSVSIGTSNTNSGYGSQALGFSLNVTGTYATALGNSSSASGLRGLAFGYNNGSSGISSTTLGNSNLASAQDSMALGNRNTANGQNSLAYGFYAHTFGIAGRKSYASGREATDGDSQYSKFVLHKRTTGNTATTLTTDSGAGGAANQVILSNQSAYRFKGTIIGKKSGTTDTAAWDIDGLIVRGANAAATTLIVGNVNVISNTPAWGTPTLTADTTNGGLQVQVTGAAATNIQWTAVIETTEVIYA